MPTQALAGFVSQLYVDTGGSTFVRIGELKDVTISIERDTIDASSHSSDGWKDFILGLAQWSASAEYIYVESDAPQDVLYDGLIDRSSLNFRFQPKGDSATTGDARWSGTGVITKWDIAGPNDDVSGTSVEVLGQGALAKTLLS